MANQYVNKVQTSNGNTLIDLTGDTVTADKLMQGYTAHDRSGALITGTATGGSGAISVVDTSDTHGGTIRTITAIDISDTTAQASDVASGKYFYTANGTKTAGTASGGGGSAVIESLTVTPAEGQQVFNSASITESIPIGTTFITGMEQSQLRKTVSVDISNLVEGATYTVSGTAKYNTSGATTSVFISGQWTYSSIWTYNSNTSLYINTGFPFTSTLPDLFWIGFEKSSTNAYYMTFSFTAGGTYPSNIILDSDLTFVPVVVDGYLPVTVNAIPSQYIVPVGTKNITSNGTGIDVASYASVNVAVPIPTTTLITKNITANGTYNASSDNADGYSSVTVNVSGGGGSNLKMGALRPDAVLIDSWSYDQYAVADESYTIPTYSTSARTVKSSATVYNAQSIDITNYDYIVVTRCMAKPTYSSDVSGAREIYWWLSHIAEVVGIPKESMTDGTKTMSYNPAYVTSGSNFCMFYYTSTGGVGSIASSSGIYFTMTAPTVSSSVAGATLTIKSPSLMLKGESSYFPQTAWNYLTDMRYQYIIELYRSPKGNLNLDGFNHATQVSHIIGCANGSGTLT